MSASDPLRMRQRIVQRADPTGRCRSYVETVKSQVIHQSMEVVAHVAGLLPRLIGSRAPPAPSVVADATVACRGERRQLGFPALTGA